MAKNSSNSHTPQRFPEPGSEVRSLYQELSDRWNQRSVEGYAELFSEDGNVIGFDPWLLSGKMEGSVSPFFRTLLPVS